MKTANRRILIILLFAFLIALSGCSPTKTPQYGSNPPPGQIPRPDTITQISTIQAVMRGVYDGETTLDNLKKQGNFGTGTFEGLDGEMVFIDGSIYQVKSSGKVSLAPDSMKTPFAVFSFFSPEQSAALGSIKDYKELVKQLDSMLPSKNFFYAVRIDGIFDYIKCRSVPKQSKPYPPLVQVTKDQPEFEMKNVKGTVLGYWFPDYANGINVPGYHLHFISDDRSQGGHLLDVALKEGNVKIDQVSELHLDLPENSAFKNTNLINDQNEINKAEK